MQGINNILSTIMGLIRNIEVSIPDGGRHFTVGQQLEAYVISGDGKMYLIQTGEKRFYAQADVPLPLGQLVKLYVAEQKDGRTWLKTLSSGEEDLLQINIKGEQPVKEGDSRNSTLLASGEEKGRLLIKEARVGGEEDEVTVKIRQALKRYGITEDREVNLVREYLTKIPLDEKTAARYLLDPHLLAALLLPMKTGNDYSRVEINQYKGTGNKQNVFEVVLNLELDKLGHLEIMLRMMEGKIYTRIWAGSADTESILRLNKEELSAQVFYLEIMPASAGPLIGLEQDDLDMRI